MDQGTLKWTEDRTLVKPGNTLLPLQIPISWLKRLVRTKTDYRVRARISIFISLAEYDQSVRMYGGKDQETAR